MEITATAKYVRMSADKARDLTRQITGMPVEEALRAVQFSKRKASVYVGKTLKSAVANAENNAKLAVDSLWVKEAVIGEGPRMKRFHARSRGSASPLLKRMSHVKIVLSDENRK